MGLGSLVFVVNAALIWLYTLSCHACRHLCGGGLKQFSKAPVRFRLWRVVSRLNGRHMQYAWASLVWVALTDVYVRLLAAGPFRDTMRGGKMLNNWRRAQIHAQEAAERVYELERWGALFDRTEDGRILQRDFGGHRFARLAHVGDRTGLEMIRTLQQHAVHEG